MTVASVQNTCAPDPEKVTVKHYQKLLTLSTNQRTSYYRYLRTTLLTESNATIKLDMKQKLDDESSEKTRGSFGHIDYARNKIHYRFGDAEVVRWKNQK